MHISNEVVCDAPSVLFSGEQSTGFCEPADDPGLRLDEHLPVLPTVLSDDLLELLRVLLDVSSWFLNMDWSVCMLFLFDVFCLGLLDRLDLFDFDTDLDLECFLYLLQQRLDLVEASELGLLVLDRFLSFASGDLVDEARDATLKSDFPFSLVPVCLVDPNCFLEILEVTPSGDGDRDDAEDERPNLITGESAKDDALTKVVAITRLHN